jgi:phosphoglycerate kinase
VEKMKYLTLDDVEVKDKVVLVRVDFNSPVDPETKKVIGDARIRAHGKTTIQELAEKSAKTVILAHQGRKGSQDFIPLKQHAAILNKVLGKSVKYVAEVFGEKAIKVIRNLKKGDILVLENVRMYDAETKKGTPEEHAKTEFVKTLAPLADLFVNDAFAAAHRAHVSIIGFTTVIKSVAGRIMERELTSLSKVLERPEKPCIFILGGAKADDSLEISRYVLQNNIADFILTGGVVGHVFLVARGYNLGKPNMNFLVKKELMDLVPGIRELMREFPGKIKIPLDVALEANGKRREIAIGELPTDYPIFDVGAKTIEVYAKLEKTAKSIVVSGPMGVYEKQAFLSGTKNIFENVANSGAFSLAGGGHTVAALQQFGLTHKISYVSTAGGALIEFLMGKKLPGVESLEKTAKKVI